MAATAASLCLPAAAHAVCASEDAVAAELSPAVARAAMTCLINEERARHDLPALKSEKHLTRTAQQHASDMVRRKFFSHTNPDGRGAVRRAKDAGYTKRYRRYHVRENIGFRFGADASPAVMFRVWLDSSDHRRHILGGFRHVGVSVVRGAPVQGHDSDPTAVTFTVSFGRRS